MDEKIPVLLDTDIGSDIDDAVCLAYLLRQPRCELVGVTTVSGQAVERAMLADAICRAAGRDDVPIHPGADTPLLVAQQQPAAQQAGVLPKWPHREDFRPNTAVDFMRDVIHSRPGEITLLTIGPLTNAGLLFALDREVPRLLRQLVMMGGVFTERPGLPALEWNAMLDPHATAIVFGAGVERVTAIGLDVTTRCTLSTDESRQKLRGGPLDLVAEMAEIWFTRADKITFHDPLAGVTIFEPAVCGYADGLVAVELKQDDAMGMTRWRPDAPEKPHRVAVEVDPQRFFDHYFGVFHA